MVYTIPARSGRVQRAAVACLAALISLLLASTRAAAQPATSLEVTVRDETEAALIHATVTLVDAQGIARRALVDETGVASFTNLAPGTYQITVEAEGFQSFAGPVELRRGRNTAIATLLVAFREQVEVQAIDPAALRGNAFSTSLTREEIEALSDDPDEMAEQLRQIAGPGAQIFIDGFQGGRLPPKDQIEQIRISTNSYSAEYHQAGMVRVEIITRPGMGDWRGTMNFGFRDDALNATNKRASYRGPEQQKRFMFNLRGPIAEGRTGLSIAADGNLSYDAQTIVARTPAGEVLDQVRRPVEGVNATVRLEQSLGAASQLRAEYSRRESRRDNLGVGDFDLHERAYSNDTVTDALRLRATRPLGSRVFGELQVELTQSSNVLTSVSEAPTVRVLDQFTAGGAGQAGTREGRQLTIAQNLDINLRRHMVRAGLLVEGGWWDSTQQSNANGTFTFSSMEEYLAGRPQTFTRRSGNPRVEYSQIQAGWFIQDDFRLGRRLSVSLGLRQEIQEHVDDRLNLAPRAAVTYALASGNLRAGYGVFYDWLEASVYEQTVRVDGTRQIDEIIVNPSYPDPGADPGTVLPASRIQLGPQLAQPIVHQASIGYDRPIGQWGTLRADYMWTRGHDALRAINVNAPVNGIRPDPTVGNVTQVESTGRTARDRLAVGLMLRAPQVRGLFGHVSYQYANTRSTHDSPLALPADSTNPDADWGPSADDIRHRVFLMALSPLPFGLRASLQAQFLSAAPYTITTGRDDNGDTVFNDRPAGIGRNSARGASHWNVNLRLTRAIDLGGALGIDEPIRLGGAPPPPPDAQPGAPGGDGPVRIAMAEPNASRYRLELYVQVFNLFNTANYTGFVGNMLSPYFGQPTSAAPPRRIELGASVTF